MASDADSHFAFRSYVSELFAKTTHLLNNSQPILNMDLNEVLDKFLGVLNEKQEYLKNGIFNVDFSEAGLFLQNSTAVLAKEIDTLWDENLQFHMQLCNIDKPSEKNKEEAVKIMERINQRRRKKIILENEEINASLNEDISNQVTKLEDFLRKCSQLQYSSELEDLWKTFGRDNKDSEQETETQPISGFRVPLKFRIADVQTKEKICNYDDLNTTACCLSVTNDLGYCGSEEWTSLNSRNDVLLQGFMAKYNATYDSFCTLKQIKEYELFKKAFRNVVDLDEVFDANLIGQGVCEFNNNVSSECLQANKGSESTRTVDGPRASSVCVSDVDSAYHDVTFEFSDDEHQPPSAVHSTRRSMADSGIYCDSMEVSRIENTPVTEIESSLTSPKAYNEFVSEAVCTSESLSNVQSVVDADVDNTTAAVTLQEEGFLGFVRLQKRRVKRKIYEDIDSSSSLSDDEVLITKVKRIQLKRYKTTTANLDQFELFCRKNYQPEPGEANNDSQSEYDDDDDNQPRDDDISFVPDPLESADVLFQIRNSEPVVTSESCDKIQEDSPATPAPAAIATSSESEECNIQSTLASPKTPSASCEEQPRPTEEHSVAVSEDDVFLETISCNSNKTDPSPTYEAANKDRMRAVTEWRQFIEPKLVNSEKDVCFDIHEYGTHIMDSVPENDTIPFKNMMWGKRPAEVARYFMATLQLANTYNIELINSGALDELANDTLEVKFLTRDRYHEHLAEYEAPSEHDFREKLAKVQALHPSTVMQSTPSTSRSTSGYTPSAKKRKISF